jgi:serine/threonine-protein kinase RsbW
MRKLMLDQTWNHENDYIKPLHFPSGKLSKTFYFSVKNPSNFHFGILGEVTRAPGDITEVIHAVDRHFREAANGFEDIHHVAKDFCHKLDESFQGVELSFQLWAMHEALDHIPVISMGMPSMKLITKTLEDVVMTFDAESQKSNNYKCASVPIAQTQYLIFTTDTCCLPKLDTPYESSEETKLESIFNLSSHLYETIIRDRDSHPDSDDEVCIVIMDLHDYTVTSESTFYGLEQCETQIDSLLRTIPSTYDPFAVKLILSELLMNAHKHGNSEDHNLPIKVIVSISEDELALEVLDMSIRMEDIPIKTDINPDNILDEHGRGLYLVNAFSDKLTIDNNSVVSRIKKQKK